MIRFNKPYLSGNELQYIQDSFARGRMAGNGQYTKQCHQFFQERYRFGKCLLTTSCTDALEMSALLLDIQPGDEVIVPSYTFVSSANAFIMHGAKIVFADVEPDFPNIDADQLEPLITEKTKAIVVVHYAGAACDMDKIMAVAKKHNIYVVEDAAQAIESTYKGRQLGGIGHTAAFSFHETKNIISGEGGMLVVNEESMCERAEIIWEKGTNRAAFYRGEVDKYTWVDVGSSFLPADFVAAYLYAQLENLEDIQQKRVAIWERYYEGLKELETEGHTQLPQLKDYQTNNGHLFYIMANNLAQRDELLDYFREKGIGAVFHYLTLHDSPYFKREHDGRELPNARFFADGLIRLPLHYELTDSEQDYIIESIHAYYKR